MRQSNIFPTVHLNCLIVFIHQQTSARERIAVGVRSGYLRVVGIQVDTLGSGRSSGVPITSDEEELFRRLASSPNIYERIARSIAPSIYGSEDIKKAIACLLFGGIYLFLLTHRMAFFLQFGEQFTVLERRYGDE